MERGNGRVNQPLIMKITFQEYEGCFSFDLEAENLADASLLARAAMNTKQATTSFGKDQVTGSLVLQKPRENRRTSYLSRPNFNKKP
jgi:hypothetical protein